jgi:hypothetical protein
MPLNDFSWGMILTFLRAAVLIFVKASVGIGHANEKKGYKIKRLLSSSDRLCIILRDSELDCLDDIQGPREINFS